jgi:hypothetical protein
LANFFETRQGVCRVTPPLAQDLAATLPDWRQAVGLVAEDVARLLDSVDRGGRELPTPIIGSNRRLGRGPGAPSRPSPAPAPRRPPTRAHRRWAGEDRCSICGVRRFGSRVAADASMAERPVDVRPEHPSETSRSARPGPCRRDWAVDRLLPAYQEKGRDAASDVVGGDAGRSSSFRRWTYPVIARAQARTPTAVVPAQHRVWPGTVSPQAGRGSREPPPPRR